MLLALALVAGCLNQPATRAKTIGGGKAYDSPFPVEEFGKYPPPASRVTPLTWAGRSGWRTCLKESYRNPTGRLSLDLEWPRMAWIEAKSSTTCPTEVILGGLRAGREVVYSARPGRIVESVRLSSPWVAVVERDELAEWDWNLLLLRVGSAGSRRLASGRENGSGKAQFCPSPAFERDLLVWDERGRWKGKPANLIRACRVSSSRCLTIAAGNVHLPALSGSKVVWNRESVSATRQGVGVTSVLEQWKEGGRRSRLRTTPYAMFASICDETVVWLDMRRKWLHQPAMADVYCLDESKRILRLSGDGLTNQALAGSGLAVWEDAAGKIRAADISRRRGYRLASFGGREAVLLDVEGRRVAYEIQPDVRKSTFERTLVVEELTKQGAY